MIWNEIYINTPFKEEMLSDVCIEIIAPHFEVNKIMNLHKNVLSQSPYFKALFNSSWIESNQEVVKITINDGNITEKSVDILFDSFYTSKLTCDQDDEDLISLIATARMFAADEVATLCAKELFKTITVNVRLL